MTFVGTNSFEVSFLSTYYSMVGIIAVLRIVNSAYEQAPLIAGLVIYGVCILSTAARFGMFGSFTAEWSFLNCGLFDFLISHSLGGWNSFMTVVVGGLSYVLLLPLFFITFLLYSVARYDTTSWR
jgi:hypothetical protein